MKRGTNYSVVTRKPARSVALEPSPRVRAGLSIIRITRRSVTPGEYGIIVVCATPVLVPILQIGIAVQTVQYRDEKVESRADLLYSDPRANGGRKVERGQQATTGKK